LAAGLDRVDLDREEPFQRRGQPQVLLASLRPPEVGWLP
jgi:hypothetical protein